MQLEIVETNVDDLRIIRPVVFGDERGYFLQSFDQKLLDSAGIKFSVSQDNRSKSGKGIMRGLHYQLIPPQAKLVSVVNGEIYDVALDLRIGSPSFGKWSGMIISSENKAQLYIPEGFAHGFMVLSESAEVEYKVSSPYYPSHSYGVLWNDPDLNISWPEFDPILSSIDAIQPKFSEIEKSQLPIYTGPTINKKTYSCFLSHSSEDFYFANKLHEDLSRNAISCWYAPEDMNIGDRIRDALEEAIKRQDKFILLLSKYSINSDWVEQEVETAFEKERKYGRTLLVPIAIDSEVYETNKSWAATIRRTRHIGDFREWNTKQKYQTSLKQLLSAFT